MTMTLTNCSICCKEKDTLQCVYCDNNTACETCHKQYITSEYCKFPECMFCHNKWDFTFIINNFGKYFVRKQLKQHMHKIIFNKEKMFFKKTIQNIQHKETLRIKQQKLKELYLLKKKKQKELKTLNMNIYCLQQEQRVQESCNTLTIIPCVHDKCNGYLTDQMVCCTCSQMLCDLCFEPLLDHKDHICKDTNISYILKNSKQCPGCGQFIEKEPGGCSQMWCVECHTTFDWKNGTMQNDGYVHNPHYYEWLREKYNGILHTDPNDIYCGGAPSKAVITTMVNKYATSFNSNMLYRIHSIILDIESILPYYIILPHGTFIDDSITQNSFVDIRQKYLTNHINEHTYKKRIFNRLINKFKKHDIGVLLTLFYHIGIDFLNGILLFDWNNDTDAVTLSFKNIDEWILYFNSKIEDISLQYECIVPYVNKKLRLDYTKFLPEKKQ